MAVFARRENPARGLYDFLKEAPERLRTAAGPNLFDPDKKIGDIDIFDFIRLLLAQGEESNAVREVAQLLDPLKERYHAYEAGLGRTTASQARESTPIPEPSKPKEATPIPARADEPKERQEATPSERDSKIHPHPSELQTTQTEAQPVIETQAKQATEKQASETITLDREAGLHFLDTLKGENLPPELDVEAFMKTLQETENKADFLEHLRTRRDGQERLAYLHLVEPTLHRPDMKLTLGEREEYIKTFRKSSGETLYNLVIGIDSGRILITMIPDVEKRYLRGQINKADIIHAFIPQDSKAIEARGLSSEIIPQTKPTKTPQPTPKPKKPWSRADAKAYARQKQQEREALKVELADTLNNSQTHAELLRITETELYPHQARYQETRKNLNNAKTESSRAKYEKELEKLREQERPIQEKLEQLQAQLELELEPLIQKADKLGYNIDTPPARKRP